MKLRLLPILLLVLLLSSFALADFTTDNQLWASLQDGNVSSFDVYGGVTGAVGVVNGAFEFDDVAGSYVEDSLNLGTTFSFNTWIKTTDGSENKYIIDFTSERTILAVYSGGNIAYYDGSWKQSSTSVIDGSWHMITLVRSGTSYELFVDNSSVLSGTGTATNLNSAFQISNDGGSNVFNGFIDEVKIFNDALNSTEIAELYNSGSPVENTVAGTNQVFYASFDSLYDQSNNSNSLSAYNGVTYDATENAYDFDGVDDYLTSSANIVQGDDAPFTFSFWVNPDISTGTTVIVDNHDNSPSEGIIYRLDDGLLNLWIDNIASDYYTIPSGSWTMVTTSYDGIDMNIYKNGALNNTLTTSITQNTEYNTFIGRYSHQASGYFDGSISGVSIYNRTLSDTEISNLYADGRSYNPYGTLVQNLTISARDSATLTNIQTFNATVNGTFYNTTSGTITLPYLLNESEILNITLEASNYFSYTNETYNASSPLVADLDPELLIDFTLTAPNNTKTNESYYNVTYTEAISPTSKTVTYNISVLYNNGTLKESFTTTNLIYELNLTDYNADIYNVSVNAEEADTGTNYTHSSLLYVDRTNYVYFQDGKNSSPLVGSNVIIDRPFGTDLNLTTDSQGKVSYQSFENFTLLNGTHTITYSEDAGYVTPLINTYNATVLPFNITYNVTRINLTINIHDEVSSNLITGTNLTVDIIDGTAYQYTTTNGTLQFDYFTPGDYEFRYYSTDVDDYKLRSDFITITGTSDQDINLYLLNESDTGITTATITFNVFGSDLSAVEDAEVVVGRYYSAQNGYVDVWSRKTDSQGKAVGQFETIDAFYQYRVIYNGEVAFISSDSGVQFNTDDDIDIFIDTSTNLVSQFTTLDDVSITDITFTQTSNTTGTFSFSFSSDTSVTACLDVTSYNFADNGFESSCVTSTGGTLLVPVTAGSYETTFVAKATIEVSSDLGPQVVDSDTQTLNGLNEPTDSQSWKENLAWIAVLVTITSALLFISFSPNAALLFQGIAFLAMTASPIDIVPIPVSVGVVFICIVLLIINVSRGRG